MRTWILGTGIIIVEAINPGYEFSSLMNWFILGLFISAVFTDLTEFLHNNYL